MTWKRRSTRFRLPIVSWGRFAPVGRSTPIRNRSVFQPLTLASNWWLESSRKTKVHDPSIRIRWSPDGRSIAVSRARRKNFSDNWRAAISFYSPDRNGELSYFETQPGWIDTHPSFSPDGKILSFLSSRTDGTQNSYSLWVRNIATGQVRQIKLLPGLNPSTDYAPRWVGNDRLIFSAVVQGKKGYYSVFL